MNTQFHTPSFGDEVFDLTDIGSSVNTGATGNNNNFVYQQQPQQQQQSKRMPGLDNPSEDYQSINDESYNMGLSNSFNVHSATTLANNNSLAGASIPQTTTLAARKQMLTTDPNEPAKPLSAYALFFRDTVSAIKQQNPNCSFQELSRIVASMWEALDPVHKNVYNKKNELARNEYLKQMRLYRQQQLEQQQQHQQQQQQQQQSVIVANDMAGHNQLLQTKPVVFTIARGASNSTDSMANFNTTSVVNNLLPSAQQQEQFQQQNPQFDATATQTQQLLYAQQTQQQQQQQQQMALNASEPTAPTTSGDYTAGKGVVATGAAPSEQQIQMLTEAGSVQKCTRENCNKRAIINPDWEDEYCSNECVVIHCRNVFNAWVQSNLEARKQ